MNDTLFQDLECFNKTNECITNISKWIPREKTKNKWLFQALSIQWCETHHPFLFKHCINTYSRIRAEQKCFMIYRKIVSKLSRSLNITEHFLASKNNSFIHFNNIPIHSLFKNWYQLFNTSQDMQIRYENSENHLLCSDNLTQSIKTCSIVHKSIPFYVNYFHFPQGIEKLTCIMFHCVTIINDYQNNHPLHEHIFTSTHFNQLHATISNLNVLWEKIFNKWYQIGDVDKKSIPIINITTSSLTDPILHRAIARACFIAQASNKRILFSAHIPIWINIQECTDFHSIITHVYYCLNKELLVNTSLENSILLLGNPHPFTPIIINDIGFCSNYNYKPTFKDCLDIFDNDRYKKIQDTFRDNIQLINGF